MVPFEPDRLPDLTGTSVFIGAGRSDQMVPQAQTERLAELLRQAGADVTVHWEAGGHGVTKGEVDAAAHWIAHCLAAQGGREAGARSVAVGR
jgi:predicted esterase